MNAFQGLYDSSIAYGMRHALVAESAKRELNEKEAKLKKGNDELEDKISEMELFVKDIIK